MGNATGRRSPSDGNGPAQGSDRVERTTGFEPATLTLAKEMELLRSAGLRPLSSLCPAGSSAQSAESAPLRPHTFNALNLYQLARGTAEPSHEDRRIVRGSPVHRSGAGRALREHPRCRSVLTFRPHRPSFGAAICALRHRASTASERHYRARQSPHFAGYVASATLLQSAISGASSRRSGTVHPRRSGRRSGSLRGRDVPIGVTVGRRAAMFGVSIRGERARPSRAARPAPD
jgi:hypothetical protein